MFTEAVVAIDRSKFKAVNNTDRNFSERKLKARIEQLEHGVGRYLDELDRADREPYRVTEARVAHVKHKIRSIRARMKAFASLEDQILTSPDGQVSLTDPDARCIATFRLSAWFPTLRRNPHHWSPLGSNARRK